MIEESGVQYSLNAGDVLFLDANTSHCGYEKVCSSVSFYWLHFSGVNPITDLGIGKNFSLTSPTIVSMLFQNILHYCGIGIDRFIANRLLTVLLYELRRQSTGNNNDLMLVHRVREWLNLNSQRNLTTADVAKEFSYNKAYLSRLCKEAFGYSLKELIDEQRIAFIKRILLESSMTTAELTSYLGFEDSNQFQKYFRYHTGITPNQFRKTYYAIHSNDQ